MEKKKINVLIAANIFSSIDGFSVDEIVMYLVHLKERYELTGWENIYVEKNYDYEYSCHNLMGLRLETDSEFSKRVKREQKELERKKAQDDKKLDRERKQYEKLRKKFEGLK